MKNKQKLREDNDMTPVWVLLFHFPALWCWAAFHFHAILPFRDITSKNFACDDKELCFSCKCDGFRQNLCYNRGR